MSPTSSNIMSPTSSNIMSPTSSNIMSPTSSNIMSPTSSSKQESLTRSPKAAGPPSPSSRGSPPGKAPGRPPAKAPATFGNAPQSKAGSAHDDLSGRRGSSRQGSRVNSRRLGPAPFGRKIYLKEILIERLEGTVWREINDMCDSPQIKNLIEDESTLGDVFNRMKISKSHKTVPVDTGVCLIGPLRARNVGILMARMKRLCDSWQQDLLKLAPGRTIDELEQVLKIIPNNSENSLINKFFTSGGKVKDLRKIPEQQMAYLIPSAVPRAAQRAKILWFEASIGNIFEHTKANLSILKKAALQVEECQSLKYFLSATLRFSNYVNYSVPAWNNDLVTKAFTIDSLTKLLDFRTGVDSRVTALHWLVANIMDIEPDIKLKSLAQELSLISVAARIPLEAVEDDIKKAQKDIQFLKNELNEECKSYAVSGGIERLKEIVQSSEQQFEKLEEIKNDTISNIKRVASAFKTSNLSNEELTEGFFVPLDAFIKEFTIVVSHITFDTRKYEFLVKGRK
eukprot:GHVP01036491.1.p1 GENE.GHVP01036491.1~~GHVP01036491.1.p1  ORF type:complete len:525 (+),score=92.53 GHVP01036491.1:43-1575(+)